MSINRNYY